MGMGWAGVLGAEGEGVGFRSALCERYGAAEVEKMNKEKRKEWLEELRFDADLEAFLEGASEKEVVAYRRGVM
jgi:hypothetical protein